MSQGKPTPQPAEEYAQQLFAAALDALMTPVSSLLPTQWLLLPCEAAAHAVPPGAAAEPPRWRGTPRSRAAAPTVAWALQAARQAEMGAAAAAAAAAPEETEAGEAPCAFPVSPAAEEVASPAGAGGAACPHDELDAIFASMEESDTQEGEQQRDGAAPAEAVGCGIAEAADGPGPLIGATEERTGGDAREPPPLGSVAAAPAQLLPPPPAAWAQAGASHAGYAATIERQSAAVPSSAAAAPASNAAATRASNGDAQEQQQQQQQPPLVGAAQLAGSSAALDPAVAEEPLAGLSATHGARVARLRAGAAPEGAVLVRRPRRENGLTTTLLTIGPEDAAPSYIGQVSLPLKSPARSAPL